MFETGMPQVTNPALEQAADRAFEVLLKAAAKLIEKLSLIERPPAQMVALHIWSLAHGIASLFGRGRCGPRIPVSPEELLESAVLLYLRGLGLARRRPTRRDLLNIAGWPKQGRESGFS